MKKLFIICSLILAAAFFTCCEKESIFLPENETDQSIGKENYMTKLERFKQIMINNSNLKEKGQLAARESFTYLSQLCGETISGETTYGSKDTISDWNFYYFFGNESDVISIYVPRTSLFIDPAFTICSGLLTTFDLSNVEMLISGDDEVNNYGPPCYGDPQVLGYALPYTGFYTLAVYNWAGCDDGTGPYTYDIITTGISCDYVDTDGDGVYDTIDNCPSIANADQADTDGDGIGDVCDSDDIDSDGVDDSTDNCPNTPNADQEDSDGDGIGDVCDNCPVTSNVDQTDTDGDGIGNVCDNCTDTSNADQADSDGDGIGDVCDNCPDTSNANQENYDGDSYGDVCDTDDDNDGCIDTNDSIDFSNMETTVNIDGCNTGVLNEEASTCGVMMSDKIDELEVGGPYTKKDSFVKAITKLASVWLGDGLINRAEYNLILKCARKASF